MSKTIEETAKQLAAAHRKGDEGTRKILYFPKANPGEVSLLEISSRVPTIGEVLPFGYGPYPEGGIDYPSTVILLSSQEWGDVESGVLKLPAGWELAEALEI